MKTAWENHLVVALSYDGMGIFEYGCAAEVFALAQPESGPPWYRFTTCSIEPRPLGTVGGLQIRSAHGLDILDKAQTILIPGWRNPDERPPAALLMKLQQAHMRGARICSLCSGAFVLGWAGLFDGKRATTHWRLTAKLQQLFPRVDVRFDDLYVDEGAVLSSAGSSASLDLLLHVITQDQGDEAANAIAKRLLVAPHRIGGQAQFASTKDVPALIRSNREDLLVRLMAEVRRDLRSPHTPASMAARVAVSQRTLQRRFLDRTGLSPGAWLVAERVALARSLLEQPAQSLADLAELTGFNSDESLRRHFRRVLGVSPGQYKRTFQRTVVTPSGMDKEKGRPRATFEATLPPLDEGRRSHPVTAA